ncbi:MAG: cysteine--tRNA ligase [Candidatus Methanomethylicota archaeon]|uniref:Cysteine--tRNA ligase n=1 Tax=Thermoproteota archaeon TaxID=2056631 RepID=A0A497F4V0_9CREN|nr:MAG: cysteine--tRNA ligase [Candidatus Verstraetearchaeota archaeon]
MQVYNTLTRKKEIFKPLDPNIVKIYVCGPTVYDKTHIGHARTYVTFDVIRRYLELKGFNVFYVVNITDIEDKIIAKSLKTGKSWKEVADEYTADFFKAVDALNIKRAHIYPRVSEHIEDIIHFIEKLIEKGHAYEAEGNVYFDVDSFSDYGKLSNISRDQLKPQEEGPGKKNPYDFALWKKAKPGEPYWQSPWGPGRPGWHIECSVMSSKYLGAQFDIHGGGQDLIFPHHENEIAQSEAYFGVNPWVKYWLHTGMLIMGTEKMSKSIGNVITVEEILKSYKPMEVRFYLLSCHYRSQLAFSDEALKHAKAAYNKILNAISSLQSILSEVEAVYKVSRNSIELIRKISEIRAKFIEAMDDDFNTPVAVSALHSLTSLVNKEVIPSSDVAAALAAIRVYEDASRILGVFEEKFKGEGDFQLISSLINLALAVRQKHRERKEWEIADWIASELRKLGIELSDMKDKTIWRLVGK